MSKTAASTVGTQPRTGSIHTHMQKRVSLAKTYAEDGAFFSAAKILAALSRDVEAHARATLFPGQTAPPDSAGELAEAASDYARLIQVESFDRNDIAVHRAYERLRAALKLAGAP